MPRIRSIKPGLFINEELAEIPPLGRLMWIGLWTIADRNGNLEYRPPRIKAQTLPYDEADVPALITQLEERGFLSRYEVNGQTYLSIPNFVDHQRPHTNELALCPIPPDDSGVAAPNPETVVLSPDHSRQSTTYKEDGELYTENGDLSGGGGFSRSARGQQPPPRIEPDLFAEVERTLGVSLLQPNAQHGIHEALIEFQDEPDPIGQAREVMAVLGDRLEHAGQRQQAFRRRLEFRRRDRQKGGLQLVKPPAPEDIPTYDTGFPFVDQLFGVMAELNLQRKLPDPRVCNWTFEQLTVHSFDGQTILASYPAELAPSDFQDWPATMREVARDHLQHNIHLRYPEDADVAVG